MYIHCTYVHVPMQWQAIIASSTMIGVIVHSLGQSCVLCSTILFMQGYKTQKCHGVLRPASLVAQLDKISTTYKPGMQQCAAEFFQDYVRVMDNTANDLYANGIIPSKCDISFLKSFIFSLRSEVLRLNCGHVSKNITRESMLPSPVKKVIKVLC